METPSLLTAPPPGLHWDRRSWRGSGVVRLSEATELPRSASLSRTVAFRVPHRFRWCKLGVALGTQSHERNTGQLHRRNVGGAVFSAVLVPKGKARRASMWLSLASLNCGSNGGLEGKPLPSAPATSVASTPAMTTPSRVGPLGLT